MLTKIGLIVNTGKKQPIQLGKDLLHWCESRGISVYTTAEDGSILGADKNCITEDIGKNVDCIVTLGGDGTILRAARITAASEVPILGVNLGVLGFLTEIEVPEIYDAMDKLVREEYYLENRMMLDGCLKNKRNQTNFIGLNDFVVKGPLARLIIVDVFVNEQYVTTYNGDGIIISSPTGSTAYSLSAGGPIIHPEVEAIIITPICPHTLHARPLVIPSEKVVRIRIKKAHADSMMTIDGQQVYTVEKNDEIYISASQKQTRLVRIKNRNFFEILQEKMKTEGRISYE